MSQVKSQPSKSDRTSLTEHQAEDSLMVAQIVENCSSENPAQAIARWRAADGQLNEQTLTIVRGVAVTTGDLVLLQRPANWPEWIITQIVQRLEEPTLLPPTELFADGKRVNVEAAEEIVLRCGKASITLRSNGRLVIRGTYVEMQASGTNRIKGGAVLIN